ncbi:MAG: class I SAM-dependent methyltransferase [Defluviitaleaceae bacterium]|nr:class I SAM-dependent methyltransferase [Defluviitaleaceae bacterium]
MNKEKVHQTNRSFWNTVAEEFGATVLPEYGVKFVTEDELNLFGNVQGKKMLEICCGGGLSLKYHADRGAGELWGVDISDKQLEIAQKNLDDAGYTATLIRSPMEADLDIPKDYFDFVYSIYGLGWTTDLQGTFNKIASYLKTGGTFIFSWNHPMTFCVGRSADLGRNEMQGGKFVWGRSYFDESYFDMPHMGDVATFRNFQMSTWVNALANAGFCLEYMSEQTSQATLQSDDNDIASLKAKLLPISVLFKARKL